MSLESQLSKAESDVQAGKNQFMVGIGAFIFFFIICGFGSLAVLGDDGVGLFFIFDAIAFVSIYFWGDNGAAAQQDVDYLKGAIQNENENKELYKKELNLANVLVGKGGIDSLKKAIKILGNYDHTDTQISLELRNLEKKANIKLAGELEEHLKYKEAIDIWEELGMHKEAKRIRNKIKEERKVKVDQTVVHGDYVDDRDTIVKDSVINRSNVGSGGDDKFTRLEKLTEMKKEGLIDDDEFKQMKKEILGK